MKNKDLIGLFKVEKELKSDKEVAEVLNIDTGFFSALKNEKSPMPVAMKFKLLGCIEYSTDVHKIAACFVDIEEHIAGMQEVKDRIKDMKKNGQAIQKKYANQNEIDRINQLMRERRISDEELAVFLETSVEHLKNVKEGDAVLNTVSKAVLYLALKGSDVIKRLIDLLPIKDETKQKWKNADGAQ